MPELPEVETIRKGLERGILGRCIVKVTVNRPKTLEGCSARDFERKLIGKTFKQVQRRAKYLFLGLESGEVILVHLKMSGTFLLHSPDLAIPKHTHVLFDLTQRIKGRAENHDSKILQLRFKDLRAFGRMSLYSSMEEALQAGSIPNLAPEPIDETFTLSYLKEKIKTFRMPIKPLLLEQSKLLSGVGNIYADEALFLSGIQPNRQANSLTDEEMEKLHKAIKSVIAKSIELGGTTIRDYVNAQGNIGEYALQLYVYGRKKQNCKICGAKLEYIRLAQRGTHYCPQCQH